MQFSQPFLISLKFDGRINYAASFLNRQRKTNQIMAEIMNISRPANIAINDTPYPAATIAGEISFASEIIIIEMYIP